MGALVAVAVAVWLPISVVCLTGWRTIDRQEQS